MQIILLERVENLGAIGDEVSVKNGYARNFLLPQGKALIANATNRARFEAERAQIEERNAKAREAAADAGKSLDGEIFTLIRQAGDTGQLYGSVAARDVVEAAANAGHKIERRQVQLNQPIKTIGLHEVGIRLHADVVINVSVNVARSQDEAERQAEGEDIIASMREEQSAIAAESAAEIAEANAEAAEERAGGDED